MIEQVRVVGVYDSLGCSSYFVFYDGLKLILPFSNSEKFNTYWLNLQSDKCTKYGKETIRNAPHEKIITKLAIVSK